MIGRDSFPLSYLKNSNRFSAGRKVRDIRGIFRGTILASLPLSLSASVCFLVTLSSDKHGRSALEHKRRDDLARLALTHGTHSLVNILTRVIVFPNAERGGRSALSRDTDSMELHFSSSSKLQIAPGIFWWSVKSLDIGSEQLIDRARPRRCGSGTFQRVHPRLIDLADFFSHTAIDRATKRSSRAYVHDRSFRSHKFSKIKTVKNRRAKFRSFLSRENQFHIIPRKSNLRYFA